MIIEFKKIKLSNLNYGDNSEKGLYSHNFLSV